ncbi:MAG: immunoglobulin domain-containing protein [Verrucomicrobiae bacterium]|nr:immunoglobulin domain-containing protein [Verrucomicrobiae bacterium]
MTDRPIPFSFPSGFFRALGWRWAMALAGALFTACPAGAQSNYAGFEARQTHPVDLTPDGALLLAVHSEAASLSVFDVSGSGTAPEALPPVPVGLEPVSVRARTANEAWVVSEVSDTVSIVVFESGVGAVAGVLPTGDEPSDVVFAAGKAFVSCARDNEIWVYDASTGALLDQVAVQGLCPSAMAVSEDGTRVFAAFLHSGNGTTVIPHEIADAPPAPTNLALPPAPQTAQIVDSGDPRVAFTVVDHDVVEIDTGTHAVVRYFGEVGTNLLGLAARPGGEELWASHTEAENLTAFEPALNGRFAQSRLGVVTLNTGTALAHDLNPGVDLNLLPNPAAWGMALSQPTAMAFEPDGNHLWVAAFASDRVARVAASDGSIGSRVDVRTGGTGEASEMRGPRGLAFQSPTGRLYVLNKLSETLSVIDTLLPEPGVVAEVALSDHEPLQAEIKAGRGYLFDARLSGNGLVSCGICHLDADRDGLAWNLGDPGGDLLTVLGANLSIHDTTPRTRVMHPMKGPMTTQTLRGMQAGAPFHWRGDKEAIADFNPTFPNLLGGEAISADDMANLTAYLMVLRLHPNPNRNLDRSLPTSFGDGNPVTGRDLFNNHLKSHCVTCHALPTGSDNNIDLPQEAGLTQPVKTPPLRTVYQRIFFNPLPGAASLSGFGLLHDGTGFELPIGHPYVLDNLSKVQELKDVSAFLMCFDTGTALAVGRTKLFGEWNREDPNLLGDLALLEARAGTTDCDLVARGRWQGEARAWQYDKGSQSYRSDRAEEGLVSRSTLLNGLSGTETLAFMGVLPGQGQRLGGDADLDGVRDGDDPSLATYDGAPRIVSDPRSQAAVPGATVTLRVTVLGGSPEFTWYRNGIPVEGATTAELVISGVSDADEGDYHVAVTNGLGLAVSRAATVEVYPAPVITAQPVSRTVNEGKSASFSVSASGTAVGYQWFRNGKAVAGATARMLSFPDAAGTDAGDYYVVVSNGAGSETSDTVALTVIEKPVVTLPVTLPAAIVGQDYLGAIAADNGATRFTVSGLPKGLGVPKGGLAITGKAQVSGTFPIRIVAYNSAGSSAPVNGTLEVRPFPEGAVGVYEATLPRHSQLNGNLGGCLMLKTGKQATFSGVLRLGRFTHRFKSRWFVTATEGPSAMVTIRRKNLPDLLLTLAVDSSSRALTGRVEESGVFVDFEGGGQIADASAYRGNHTMALLTPLVSEGDEGVPQGDGVGGFIVTDRSLAKGMIRLADGAIVKFAAPVVEGGWVRMFQPLYRNTGSLCGRLRIAPGVGHRLEGSQLSWWKEVQTANTRVYPNGHAVLDLRVIGGFYTIPPKGETLPGLATGSLDFFEGGAPDPENRLDVAEVAFAARHPSKGTISGANPGLVGVALAPGAGTKFGAGSTGAFSGTFTLFDPDTTVAGDPQRKRRAVFRGMVVDDGSGPKGYGFFLLPKMPETGPPATTLKNSPILSGRVRLNPAP